MVIVLTVASQLAFDRLLANLQESMRAAISSKGFFRLLFRIETQIFEPFRPRALYFAF